MRDRSIHKLYSISVRECFFAHAVFYGSPAYNFFLTYQLILSATISALWYVWYDSSCMYGRMYGEQSHQHTSPSLVLQWDTENGVALATISSMAGNIQTCMHILSIRSCQTNKNPNCFVSMQLNIHIISVWKIMQTISLYNNCLNII